MGRGDFGPESGSLVAKGVSPEYRLSQMSENPPRANHFSLTSARDGGFSKPYASQLILGWMHFSFDRS
jgi:hypothetical protein